MWRFIAAAGLLSVGSVGLATGALLLGILAYDSAACAYAYRVNRRK